MQPIKQRSTELDLLRGISLLGILLINIQVFSTTFFLWGEWFTKFPGTLDNIVFRSVVLFVTQRFIGIFSLVYGISVAIQRHKYADAPHSFRPYYFRRMGILALFGTTNLLLFFWGDVLLIYSVFSLLLFFFLDASNSALLVGAAIVFLLPAALYCIPSVAHFFESSSSHMRHFYTPDQFISVYRSGSVFEMARARVLDYTISYLPDIIWHRTSFAMMLLGYWVGRNSLHLTYMRYIKQLSAFLYISGPLCIIYAVAFYADPELHRHLFFKILEHIYTLASVFIYVILAVIFYQKGWLAWLTKMIANVGRLSLSNYILQQVLCAFIFHNYGLSLYFATGAFANVCIALAIFFIQVIASNLYLTKYKTGPLEWLWRSGNRSPAVHCDS